MQTVFHGLLASGFGRHSSRDCRGWLCLLSNQLPHLRTAGLTSQASHPFNQQHVGDEFTTQHSRSDGKHPSLDSEILQPFLKANMTVAPVTTLEGLPAPTAFSWLKKKGLPGLPISVLYRAFKQRQVRVFDGSSVKRVTRTRELQSGDILLYPQELLKYAASYGRKQAEISNTIPAWDSLETDRNRHHKTLDSSTLLDTSMSRKHHIDGVNSSQSTLTKPASDTTASISMQQQAKGSLPKDSQSMYCLQPGQPPGIMDTATLTDREIRRWVLDVSPHVIFINKPAGIPVQGPGPSIDSLMRNGLRLGAMESPRLVHRLDRNVSGVMAVARSSQAAALLSTFFQDKSDEGFQVDSQLQDVPEGGGVRRVYWALLAGTISHKEGKIRYPIMTDGRYRQAVTAYRVRETSPLGITWIELQPITGRKHQLRIHCAKVLQAPIIGDVRYGYRGLNSDFKLARKLPKEWWQAFSPQNAEQALRFPSQKERRRAAAARAMQLKALEREADFKELDSDVVDELDEVENDANEVGTGALMPGSDQVPENATDLQQTEAEHILPVFLHSRRLLVKFPRKDALKAVAPLPAYMADVITSMGWRLPPGSQPF